MGKEVEKRILVKNSASGVIQLLITAVLIFVSIPIFIGKLGEEQYGLFALISVIGNLNVFINLGLSPVLIKYISEQGKCRESENDILAALLITFAVILLISLPILLFKRQILAHILNVPAHYMQSALVLFTWMWISNMILLIGQLFAAVLDALQYIVLTNLLQFIYSVVYWGGILLSILIGRGLREVAYVVFLAAVVWVVLLFIQFSKRWGRFSFDWDLQTIINAIKKQLSYGIKISLSGVIGFFNEPLLKILASNFFGLHVVSYLEIGLKIRGQISNVINKIMQPYFPYVASIKSRTRISFLVSDVTQKIFILLFPLYILVMMITSDVMKIWLQTSDSNYTIFSIGLIIPFILFSPLTIPIYMYLIAKGFPEKTIIFQSVSALAIVSFFFVLKPFVGIYTIVWANALSYFMSYLLGIYYQNKYLGITYVFRKRWFFVFVCVALLLVGLYFVSYYFMYSILRVIFFAIIVYPLATRIYFRFGILHEKDIQRYFGDSKRITNVLKVFMS